LKPGDASIAPGAGPAPLVSVVVPVYNGALHLLETLRSVAAQTHEAIEIIVVDDASPDDSAELARASGLASQVLRQANAGVSAARNTGLAAARGEFVCFLDQDDHWYPDHLQGQLAAFARHPDAGVVVSPYQHWYPRAGRHEPPDALRPPPPAQAELPDYSGWVYHQFMLDCWALTSATMIRRSVLLAYGGFDARLPFSEDWELWLRLSRQVPFVHLAGPPVLYRQHGTQGSRFVRPVDHRSELLLQHERRYGLASRDGRALARRSFQHRLARYQMEFGRHHLEHGERSRGVRALWAAWQRHPGAWRYLAMAAAGALGWRPHDALTRAPAAPAGQADDGLAATPHPGR
jgi:glycosyltransferase involved in cell wall biosynthesis